MKRILSFVMALIVLSIMCLSTGCKKADKREKFSDYSFDSFDTVTTIVGYEEDEKEFKKNCEKIKELLYEYHKLYTIYTKYNGLNNLCLINETTHEGHEKLAVDSKIIEKLFSINYDYANRIFKQYFGLSINRYRNKRRIDRAKFLLVTTDKTLEEIAQEVGFDDKYYFSRLFAKYEGISPLQYRSR